MVHGVVGDVLAEALLAAAPQADDRALALEVARDARPAAARARSPRSRAAARHSRSQVLTRAASPSRRLTSSSRRSSSSASPTALSSLAQSSISALPSLHQLERLVEARLAGVQPPDDLLDARGGRLVAGLVRPLGGRRLRIARRLRIGVRRGSCGAAPADRSSGDAQRGSVSSAKRRRTRSAARAAPPWRAARRRGGLDQGVAALERPLRVVRRPARARAARARAGAAGGSRAATEAALRRAPARGARSGRARPRRRRREPARSSRSCWCRRAAGAPGASAGARESVASRRARESTARRPCSRRRPAAASVLGRARAAQSTPHGRLGRVRRASSSSRRRRRRAACGRCGARPTRSRARRASRRCGTGSRRRSTAGRPASRRRARRSPPRPPPRPARSASARTIAGAAWRSCTGAKRPHQPPRPAAARERGEHVVAGLAALAGDHADRARQQRPRELLLALEQALGVELLAQALDAREQVALAGDAQVARRRRRTPARRGAARGSSRSRRRRPPACPSAGAAARRARRSLPSRCATRAQGIAPVASRSSKYTRAREGRRFTSSPISCTRANERSFARSAAAYSPTGNGPGERAVGDARAARVLRESGGRSSAWTSTQHRR